MSEAWADRPNVPPQVSAEDLALEMGRARDRYARFYAEAYEVTVAEAAAHIDVSNESRRDDLVQRSESKPAHLATWVDLDALTHQHPEAARRLWLRINERAHEELSSGHRAARALEPTAANEMPIDRARFMVVRDELRHEWKPRRGSESQMIDVLAQLFTVYEIWLERHVQCLALTGYDVTEREKASREAEGSYITRRLSEAEEAERTFSMAQKTLGLYLRTLRSLRDLRRVGASIRIDKVDQLNLGEQQVNTTNGR